MLAPDRVCPLCYRHDSAALAATGERPAEILYVIGGLYDRKLKERIR